MQMKEHTPVCEHCGFDERTENQAHQLPIGTLLHNQYLVGRVLGQGGFGITYIGWDQHLSVPVAIKEYFPGGIVQRHTQLSTKVSCVNGEAPEVFAKHRERFLKEARTLAQLAEIPEIVQVKSFFASNDTAYIVMDYIHGNTLKSHLKQLGRPMSETEALTIMKPVIKALQKVHEHGLIHRDISPDNIMLPQNGGIKLIDFGTVRYMDDSGKSKSTETVLKPGFAPMEQYITRGKLGPWTDVYALCATFHYLLTGKIPEEAMVRLDGDGSLPTLRRRKDLSSGFIAILEKGMQVRIPDRLQSAEELYDLLYCGKALIPENKADSASKPDVKDSGLPKKHKVLPIFLTLLLLLLCAGVWMMQTSSKLPAVQQPLPPSSGPQAPEHSDTATTDEDRYQEAAELADQGQYARAAILYASLGDYRDSRALSFETWALVPNRQTISFYSHSDTYGESYCDMIHAIRKDGSVVADPIFSDAFSEESVDGYFTSEYQGIVSIHGAIGLKYDGTLALPENVHKFDNMRSWSNIAAIASYEYPMESFDYYLYVGLKTDGTVAAAGSIPVSELGLDSWSDITAIACEMNLVAGLKQDGTVIATGRNAPDPKALESWQNIIDIAVGPGQVLGLRADGTVLAAGENTNNVLNLVNEWEWKNVCILSDGPYGIKSDGSIVSGCSGEKNNRGNVYGWNDLAAVACNQWQTVGLKKDGSLVFTADGWGFYSNAHSWDDILMPNEVIADPQTQYGYAESWAREGQYAKAAVTFGSLGYYRDSYERSMELWRMIFPSKTISAGNGCTAMIREDGTVISPAVQDPTQYAVSSWRDIRSVSAGRIHTAGLKSDGTVVVTSSKLAGRCASWTNILEVCAANDDILALCSDGTVVAIDDSRAKQVSDWTDIVAIHSSNHAVGLRMDGTVVAVGNNSSGQCNVEDWTDIISVRTASTNNAGLTVGLKTDGSVVVTGSFDTAQYDISFWNDLVAVDAGMDANGAFLVGLKSDGTVVASGNNTSGQCNVEQWQDIVAISAGPGYVLGLKTDGTLVSAGQGSNGETRVSHLNGIKLP